MKLIALIATQVFSVAFGMQNFCAVTESSSVTKMVIPSQPNYFFRTFPDSKYISYASSDGNYIFDMKTNQQYLLPGEYDPVPMGESVMSVPSRDSGMTFYSISEILKGNSHPIPLTAAPGLLGVYQSVGLISKTADTQIYGIIVAGTDSTLFQKVKVTLKPDLKVEALDQPVELCKSVDIKLPMLSKNAQEISGLDMKTSTTKIWKIDYKTSSCKEVDNLGIPAGKADFSYDGTQLTFHLRADAGADVSYFRTPGADMSMNVFIYDRKSKRLAQVSQGQPGENAYYPVFRRDGSIVYAIADSKSKPFFAHADMKNAKAKQFTIQSAQVEKKAQNFMAIGKLWNQVCFKDYSLRTVEAVLKTGINLKKTECKSLVNETWTGEQIDRVSQAEVNGTLNGKIKYMAEEIKVLSKRDLEDTCDLLE